MTGTTYHQSILSQNLIIWNWIIICLMRTQKLAISNFKVTIIKKERKEQKKKYVKKWCPKWMYLKMKKNVLHFDRNSERREDKPKKKEQKKSIAISSLTAQTDRLVFYNLLAENEILHNWKSISKKCNQLMRRRGRTRMRNIFYSHSTFCSIRLMRLAISLNQK